MNKYKVQIYNDFWNRELQRCMYVEAENEFEARSKGYDSYCRTLIFRPLAQPVVEATLCE